jgi:hypothetical protein
MSRLRCRSFKTGLYRGNRSLEELHRSIARDLSDAERNQQSVVIRPLFKDPMLIQLDDLDRAKAERTTPHAFMVIRTSAGKDGNLSMRENVCCRAVARCVVS